MADLFAPLNQHQQTLLNVMAGPFLETGQWPVWHFVQDYFDRRDLDAGEILRSLPRVGLPGHGPAYGLAWFERAYLAEDARPALTVAAALHEPLLEEVFGRRFLLVLRELANVYTETPSSPDAVTRPTITSGELSRRLGGISDDYLTALPGIFDHEPSTWHSSRQVEVGSPNWAIQLRREILKYRDIQDLGDYVKRVVAQIPEPEIVTVHVGEPSSHVASETRSVTATHIGSVVTGNIAAIASPAEAPAIAVSGPPLYVETILIEGLEAKAETSAWSLDKLIQLAHELNSNYAAGNAYSCHTLLRAIIDHVPPLFGATKFEQVVANHSWGRTDKGYVTKLKDFRAQADDVLHRHIEKHPSLITMDDMPPRAPLNTLLKECIELA
ncbi:hypothetical protein ACFV0O_03785 [Kitasatospora sp. NPDC059577]|uniref:hypothetical protein n=1 Tax=Kitasatospora sp. NPDC059577 TaxID=3346873 RepID=UPI00368BC86D